LDVVACVKPVPETAEAELKIDSTGKNIEKAGSVYDINEWDDYPLESSSFQEVDTAYQNCNCYPTSSQNHH
jgi:hypothetical protein